MKHGRSKVSYEQIKSKTRQKKPLHPTPPPKKKRERERGRSRNKHIGLKLDRKKAIKGMMGEKKINEERNKTRRANAQTTHIQKQNYKIVVVMSLISIHQSHKAHCACSL